MRHIVLVAGVILICLIIWMKSRMMEAYTPPPTIYKSKIGLLINPPRHASESMPAQQATCESIRTLANGIHTQVNNLCKEGFLAIPQEEPTNAEIEAHEALLVELNNLKAQIEEISPEDTVCTYAYKPVMEILSMLEPEYELDNNIKHDMAVFLTQYFAKVLHLNSQVHGLTNICDMVSSGSDEDKDKEFIMEKFLDMVSLITEISHLKQNKQNNTETTHDVRRNRAALYKEYKAKIKAIMDNHRRSIRKQLRAIRSPFKRVKKLFKKKRIFR